MIETSGSGQTTIGARTVRTPSGWCASITINRTARRLRANGTLTNADQVAAAPGKAHDRLQVELDFIQMYAHMHREVQKRDAGSRKLRIRGQEWFASTSICVPALTW
jgi:hypothetical protein